MDIAGALQKIGEFFKPPPKEVTPPQPQQLPPAPEIQRSGFTQGAQPNPAAATPTPDPTSAEAIARGALDAQGGAAPPTPEPTPAATPEPVATQAPVETPAPVATPAPDAAVPAPTDVRAAVTPSEPAPVEAPAATTPAPALVNEPAAAQAAGAAATSHTPPPVTGTPAPDSAEAIARGALGAESGVPDISLAGQVQHSEALGGMGDAIAGFVNDVQSAVDSFLLDSASQVDGAGAIAADMVADRPPADPNNPISLLDEAAAVDFQVSMESAPVVANGLAGVGSATTAAALSPASVAGGTLQLGGEQNRQEVGQVVSEVAQDPGAATQNAVDSFVQAAGENPGFIGGQTLGGIGLGAAGVVRGGATALARGATPDGGPEVPGPSGATPVAPGSPSPAAAFDALTPEERGRLVPEGGALPSHVEALGNVPGYPKYAAQFPERARQLADMTNTPGAAVTPSGLTGSVEAELRARETAAGRPLSPGERDMAVEDTFRDALRGTPMTGPQDAAAPVDVPVPVTGADGAAGVTPSPAAASAAARVDAVLAQGGTPDFADVVALAETRPDPGPIPGDPLGEVLTPEQMRVVDTLADVQSQIPQTNLTPEQIDRYATDYYGAGAPVQGRRLDIVMGGPGAGKTSTLVDPLVAQHGSLLVDSDLIKPQLPGFGDGVGASAVHAAAANVSDEVIDRALANGDNVVWSMMGGDPQWLGGFIQEARNQGYTVGVHVAELPPEVAAGRVYDRMFSSGQIVPPEVVFQVGDRPVQTFDQLVSQGLADSHTHLDTNVPYGAPPIVVRRDE